MSSDQPSAVDMKYDQRDVSSSSTSVSRMKTKKKQRLDDSRGAEQEAHQSTYTYPKMKVRTSAARKSSCLAAPRKKNSPSLSCHRDLHCSPLVIYHLHLDPALFPHQDLYYLLHILFFVLFGFSFFFFFFLPFPVPTMRAVIGQTPTASFSFKIPIKRKSKSSPLIIPKTRITNSKAMNAS